MPMPRENITHIGTECLPLVSLLVYQVGTKFRTNVRDTVQAFQGCAVDLRLVGGVEIAYLNSPLGSRKMLSGFMSR